MRREPILRVAFYAREGGRESVRDWLREFGRNDRQMIGADLKTAQFGGPMGMPLIRKLDADLWEIRSRVRDRVVRTPFTVEGGTMVILHAFVKKSAKAPDVELDVARRRLARLNGRPRRTGGTSAVRSTSSWSRRDSWRRRRRSPRSAWSPTRSARACATAASAPVSSPAAWAPAVRPSTGSSTTGGRITSKSVAGLGRNTHVRVTDGMQQARQLRGLTQVELAELMGISQGRVSRLESVHHDRRLDSLAACLHAVGADLLVALKVGDQLIQVVGPAGTQLVPTVRADAAVGDAR